jgi:hypothetical protein
MTGHVARIVGRRNVWKVWLGAQQVAVCRLRGDTGWRVLSGFSWHQIDPGIGFCT